MQDGQPPITAQNPSPAKGQSSVAQLLYVEDNTQVAEITCIMLEDCGLDVIRATSAEEALQIISEADGPPPFDIVLTDIVMPGLSGVQLARRLNLRWPELPIILVSGYSEELAMGYASQYELLPKPFTRGALFASLQRHLDKPLHQPA